MSYRIFSVENFKISDTQPYPFIDGLGYFPDRLSEKIVFPIQAYTFNMNETFVYFVNSNTILLYIFYSKRFLLVKMPQEIDELKLYSPGYLILKIDKIIYSVDLTSVKTNTLKYLTTEDLNRCFFHDNEYNQTCEIETISSIPIPEANYFPSFLPRTLMITKEKQELKVSWNIKRKENVYTFSNAEMEIDSIVELYNLYLKMIPIFFSYMNNQSK